MTAAKAKLNEAYTAAAKKESRNGLTFAVEVRGGTLALLHLAMPLAVILLTWLLLIQPNADWVHPMAKLSPLRFGTFKSWTRVTPLCAISRESAWELGDAQGGLSALLKSRSGDGPLKDALGNAEAVIAKISDKAKSQRPVLSKDGNVKSRAEAMVAILAQARSDTLANEGNAGVGNFLRKCFSLINIISFVSIAGILISVGPFLSSIIASLAEVALLCWQNCISHLWRPVLYVFIAGSFAFCSDPDPATSLDVRVYTALLCAGLLMASIVFTLVQLVACGALKDSRDSTFVLLLGFALFLPLALMMQSSSLLGFITTGWLFAALGFGMWSMWGGYAIGFSSMDEMDRCALASLAILLLNIGFTVCKIESASSFSSGMQVFGATAGYLALLCKSSGWTSGDSRRLLLYGAIAIGVVVGSAVPLLALRNTALVYSYLCFLDLLAYSSRDNFWAGIFLCSLFMYLGALALHRWPMLLVSLYGSSNSIHQG